MLDDFAEQVVIVGFVLWRRSLSSIINRCFGTSALMPKTKNKKVKRAVVRAVDALVKTKKKNKKKNKNKMPSGGGRTFRGLMNGMIPKSSLSVSGNMDVMRVVGSEVIAEITTSQTAVVTQLGINPAIAQIFPKLSGLSLQFERYRFKRLRLNYFTACPATRSGAIGIALHTEFSAFEPSTFMPEFASFAYAAVGAVSESFSTPWWTPKDPEHFFIGIDGLGVIDPLKVYQGKIIGLTRDCVAADAKLIGGYLGIEYEVEFFNSRPTLNKVNVNLNANDQTMVGGGNIIADVGYSVNTVGRWGETAVQNINSSVGTVQRVWEDVQQGLYLLDYIFNADAKTLEEKAVVRDGYVRVNQRSEPDPPPESYTVTIWVDSKYVKKQPGWLEIPEHLKGPRETKDGVLRHEPMGPEVAGDMTVSLYTFDEKTAATAVYNATFSGGTGAVSPTGVFSVTVPDSSHSWLFAIAPTGTESRVVHDLFCGWAPINLGS